MLLELSENLSYRSKISRAHATASRARIPDGCGLIQSSRFSGRLSSLIPFDVVNGLALEQMAAENLLHDHNVLEHVRRPDRRPGMTGNSLQFGHST